MRGLRLSLAIWQHDLARGGADQEERTTELLAFSSLTYFLFPAPRGVLDKLLYGEAPPRGSNPYPYILIFTKMVPLSPGGGGTPI